MTRREEMARALCAWSHIDPDETVSELEIPKWVSMCGAIDTVLDVLTKPPTVAMVDAGLDALADPGVRVEQVFEAMIRALIEERKS